MNDLFTSGSFKKYADLKNQAALDDMESGAGGEGANLEQFFEEVEGVKGEMRGLEALHGRLQASHEGARRRTTPAP